MQIVKQSAKTMEEGFELLKEAAILDYNSFIKDNAAMQLEYRDSFRLENGQKYAKVISKNSVFAFIVKEDNQCLRRVIFLKLRVGLLRQRTEPEETS